MAGPEWYVDDNGFGAASARTAVISRVSLRRIARSIGPRTCIAAALMAQGYRPDRRIDRNHCGRGYNESDHVLVLKPKADATDNYHVMHGELQVGQIYKRKAALRPEAHWLWDLNGVPAVPAGVVLTGLAGTLDEAMAALEEGWSMWLASAELSETGGTQP